MESSKIYIQYKNPPVKEAIFTFSFLQHLSAEMLDAFAKSDFVKSKYDDNSGVLHPSNRKDNLFLKTKDETSLVQIRATRISYHNVNKYSGWEKMFLEAKELLEEFYNTTKYQGQVTQVGVRYVNHINLPPDVVKGNIEKYVRLIPSIPSEIDSHKGNFFLQIPVFNEKLNLQGMITETFLPSKPEEGINFLLDITVSENGAFNYTDNNLWNTLSKIRDYKNHLFINSITEETQKFFN